MIAKKQRLIRDVDGSAARYLAELGRRLNRAVDVTKISENLYQMIVTVVQVEYIHHEIQIQQFLQIAQLDDDADVLENFSQLRREDAAGYELDYYTSIADVIAEYKERKDRQNERIIAELSRIRDMYRKTREFVFYKDVADVISAYEERDQRRTNRVIAELERIRDDASATTSEEQAKELDRIEDEFKRWVLHKNGSENEFIRTNEVVFRNIVKQLVDVDLPERLKRNRQKLDGEKKAQEGHLRYLQKHQPNEALKYKAQLEREKREAVRMTAEALEKYEMMRDRLAVLRITDTKNDVDKLAERLAGSRIAEDSARQSEFESTKDAFDKFCQTWLELPQFVDMKEMREEDCLICYDAITPGSWMVTTCGHVFHRECLQEQIKTTSAVQSAFLHRVGIAHDYGVRCVKCQQVIPEDLVQEYLKNRTGTPLPRAPRQEVEEEGPQPLNCEIQ